MREKRAAAEYLKLSGSIIETIAVDTQSGIQATSKMG